MLAQLPFRQVWIVDTEFRRPPGEPAPDPVCCIAACELISGQSVRLWTADGPVPCPYDTGPWSLFVAHYSPAEWAAHKALGWPIPRNVIDTYAEARAALNGLPWGKCDLLEVCARYGIPTIAVALKKAGQELAQRGGPWSADERADLIDYCVSDVDTNADLFLKLLPEILSQPYGLDDALIRGLYMRALAEIDHCGIPVDSDLLGQLQADWDELKRRLIRAVDTDTFDCYEGTTFKRGKFATVLDRLGLSRHWPRTPTGMLSTEAKVFKGKADAHPELRPLYELHSTLSHLKKLALPVGSDQRHRPERLGPFGTDTGRNAPKGSIFAPARWVRSLIRPEPGRALVYSDYSAQEVHIAARRSGDANLIKAVESGDPYLWYAREADQAPPDATKESHEALRDRLKILLLGTGYGLTAHGASQSMNIGYDEASSLLARHQRLFPVYWAWAEDEAYRSIGAGICRSRFGWPMKLSARTKYNTILNHPVQSAGADVLRIAVIELVDAALNVCMPVHDAVLTECALEDVDEHTATVERIMRMAAACVVGTEIPVDHKVIRWPDRYSDKRGAAMFATIMALLDEIRETSAVAA